MAMRTKGLTLLVFLLTIINAPGFIFGQQTCPGVTMTRLPGTLVPVFAHKVSDTTYVVGVTNSSGYNFFYRSVDSGLSWTVMDFPGSDDWDEGILYLRYKIGISTISWSDADHSVGYFMNPGGNLYVTKDGGATFTTSTPHVTYNGVPYIGTVTNGKVYPYNLKTHPKMPGWVVVEHFSPFCFAENFASYYFNCPLYNDRLAAGLAISYSKDYGVTWFNIWSYQYTILSDFNWPAIAGEGNVTLETAFATQFSASGSVLTMLATDNWFASYTSLTTSDVSVVDSFVRSESVFIVAEASNAADVSAYTYNVIEKKLYNSQFPVNANSSSGPTRRFFYLDDSNGTSFVAAQRAVSQSDRVDLYVSDLAGDYTLSLPGLAYDGTRPPVFEKMSRLQGVYFASRWDETGDKKSYVTFNNGGEWQLLQPPSALQCTGCTLHMWGPQVNARFKVRTAGFGVVASNGNVGDTILPPEQTPGGVFLSRDTGITFERIVNGSRVFDISDFGEFMASAVWDSTTNTVSYSFDEGVTWTTCLFNDPAANNETYTVSRLYVSLDFPESHLFPSRSLFVSSYNPANSIVWLEVTDSSNQNLLVAINFSHSEPQCAASDYEAFAPPGGASNCVLGSRSTFTRKKRDSKCIADPNVLSTVTQVPCPCSRDDFRCVFCFVEVSATNSTCVLDTTNPKCTTDPGIPTTGCGNFSVASVYKKIASSACVSDDSVTDLLANRTISVTCPPPPPSSQTSSATSGGYIALGVVIALLVAGIIAFVIYKIVKMKCIGKAEFNEDMNVESPRGKSDLPVGDLS